MFFLDYLAFHNCFSRVSIPEKLAVGLGGLLLAVGSGQLTVNLAIFLFMSAVLLRAGMPLRYWLRLWGTLLPFLLTAIATIVFSFSLEPFAALWSIQLGAVTFGVTESGRLTAQGALMRSAADKLFGSMVFADSLSSSGP